MVTKSNVKFYHFKMIFPISDQPFVLHFAKFFGQRTAVKIEIIRHLLAVEWDVKCRTSGACDLLRKIDRKPLADCLWRSAEYAAGQDKIFLHGNKEKIAGDLLCKRRIFRIF